MTGPADDLDLPDRRSAASALNRLAHALVRHRAQPSVLQRIAVEAERLAGTIELEPRRERRLELAGDSAFQDALRTRTNPKDEGAFVDMFDDSPVSGSANPLSMGLRVGREGDEAVARTIIQPGWQGAPERAHGGIVAAMVDETLGAVLPILGVVAFTGELTLRYVAPAPLGVPVEFRARATGRERRKLFLECEGSSADGAFVRATSIFVTIDLERFRG